MAANVPPSPDGPPPAEDGNDADEAGGTDGGDGAATPPPSASSASSASESSLPPPLGDGESPPPLDYGALAARIAALPTADEVGGAVHRFDTIEPADAAGYAAAYRSAVSLFLLLVGGKGGAVGGAAGGRSGGVSGNDVYAIAVGRDRVALVFATRTDAIMYGRMMLGKAGSGGYRRVRVAELEPNDVERLCESGGLRLGFVPAGALSVQRPGADGGEGAVVEETTDEDVLADGDMDAEEAAAMREKLNKLFQSGGGSL